MKKYTLKAKTRTVVGRKVKKLRTEGIIPATLYGRKIKSISLALSENEFLTLWSQAGETGIIELSVDSLAARPVLIHHVQKHAVSDSIIHVEFFQVDLKQKVRAKIPIELKGESPAVASKIGVILTISDQIEVEALPAELPEKITVDISQLTDVNQELKVSDLRFPAGVTVLSDTSLTIVKVGALVSKAVEAESKAEEAAKAASEAAATATAGTQATEEQMPTGETPSPSAPPASQTKPSSEKTPEEKKS